jgi:hypothetical protein
MKMSVSKIKYFFMSFIIFMTSFSFIFMANAQISGSPSLDQQQAECAKNTAAEWSMTLNRCVGKVEARQTRHDVQDCAALTDPAAQTACHNKIAESKTGLNSNPDSLPEGTVGKSAVMNGAASAYAVIGMINGVGKSGTKSKCTSKTIFGYTALAGTLTDIWLKIQAQKKIDELKEKYLVGSKDSAYEGQLKAFQYLRDEQEVIKDIASKEKTRNMLLVLGYGAASAMALYEMMSPVNTPGCLEKVEATAETNTATASTPANANAAPAGGATATANTAAAGNPTDGSSNNASDATSDQGASESSNEHRREPSTEVTTSAASAEAQVKTPVADVSKPNSEFIMAKDKNGNVQVYGVNSDGSRNGTVVVQGQVLRGNTVVANVDTGSMSFKKLGSDVYVRSDQLPSYVTNPIKGTTSYQFTPITGGGESVKIGNGTSTTTIVKPGVKN